MRATWIVIAVCLILVGMYFWFEARPGGAGPSQSQGQPESSLPDPAPSSINPPPTPKPETDRTELEEPPESAPPKKPTEEPSQELVHVDPFSVRIHAVDREGQSVPGARIAVLQAKRVPHRSFRIPGRKEKKPHANAYSGPLAPLPEYIRL